MRAYNTVHAGYRGRHVRYGIYCLSCLCGVVMSGFFNLQRIITRSNCNRSYSLSNSTPDCTRASKRGVTTSFDTPVGDRARRYPKFPYLSMQVEYMLWTTNMVRIQRVDVNINRMSRCIVCLPHPKLSVSTYTMFGCAGDGAPAPKQVTAAIKNSIKRIHFEFKFFSYFFPGFWSYTHTYTTLENAFSY